MNEAEINELLDLFEQFTQRFIEDDNEYIEFGMIRNRIEEEL